MQKVFVAQTNTKKQYYAIKVRAGARLAEESECRAGSFQEGNPSGRKRLLPGGKKKGARGRILNKTFLTGFSEESPLGFGEKWWVYPKKGGTSTHMGGKGIRLIGLPKKRISGREETLHA